MYSLFGLCNDNIGHYCVAIFLAKMLIWAPFYKQYVYTFSVLTPGSESNMHTMDHEFILKFQFSCC